MRRNGAMRCRAMTVDERSGRSKVSWKLVVVSCEVMVPLMFSERLTAMRVLKGWLMQSALAQALPSGSEYLTTLRKVVLYL